MFSVRYGYYKSSAILHHLRVVVIADKFDSQGRGKLKNYFKSSIYLSMIIWKVHKIRKYVPSLIETYVLYLNKKYLYFSVVHLSPLLLL